jgi:hypothetical protein
LSSYGIVLSTELPIPDLACQRPQVAGGSGLGAGEDGQPSLQRLAGQRELDRRDDQRLVEEGVRRLVAAAAEPRRVPVRVVVLLPCEAGEAPRDVSVVEAGGEPVVEHAAETLGQKEHFCQADFVHGHAL